MKRKARVRIGTSTQGKGPGLLSGRDKVTSGILSKEQELICIKGLSPVVRTNKRGSKMEAGDTGEAALKHTDDSGWTGSMWRWEQWGILDIF